MPFNIGSTEVIILLLVLVLLFGATRLPKAAEGIGKSLKVFKREIRSSSDDDEAQAQQNGQANSQAIAGQTQTTTESATPTTPGASTESAPRTHQQNN